MYHPAPLSSNLESHVEGLGVLDIPSRKADLVHTKGQVTRMPSNVGYGWRCGASEKVTGLLTHV